MELAGKTALVTGSSRGIGVAIARTFAANGAFVAGHGRDQEALTKVHAQILADGGKAEIYLADLTSLSDIEGMRNRVAAECGPLDILVANGGGSFARPAPIEEIDPAEWNAAIAGNLTATFLTVRDFLPDMKKRGSANIITLSSAAARKPHPVAPVAYAAAKAGVQIFTKDLAAQAGPYGIRANCFAPETILTERNEQRIPSDRLEVMRLQHPIPRLGSERSSWITGIIMDVAGGAVLV